VPDFRYATVKIVNSHPKNPSQHQLPSVMAVLLAVHPDTGAPVAIMDGTAITTKRTAAASALATDHLAINEARTLGFIGTGKQAKSQLQGQQLVRNFTEVLLYDVNDESAKQFRHWIESEVKTVSVTILEDTKRVVSESDVVISITPSTSPLVDNVNLPEHVHINALGADSHGKQEWSERDTNRCEVVVDDWNQASHSGEISQMVSANNLQRREIRGTIGELLLESPDQRDLQSRATIFDSTGLAIQDTAAANVFLNQEPEPETSFPFFTGDGQ